MSEEVEKLQSFIKEKSKADLISLITSKTRQERAELYKAYNQKYNKDLAEVLKKELSGDFKDLCMVIFKDPIDYDCESIYLAMKGAGTNEATLIDIIGSRKRDVLKKISTRFSELYKGKDIVKEIEDETSGDFQKILIALLKGERVVNDKPDTQICDDLAKQFDELVNKKKKENALATLEEIFVKRSPKEMAFISRAYHRLTGKTILEGINTYASGDLKELLTTIIYAHISPSEYNATQIRKSIKGAGTNEDLLNRIIINRSEIDIQTIGKYYEKLYNIVMIDDIKDDTSGDYQTLLVKLCGY